MTLPAMERALDLMVENATEGLGPRRLRELDELMGTLASSAPDDAAKIDKESFELAAAAVELAYAEADPMPVALRQRVARQAEGVFGFPADSLHGGAGSNVVRFPAPRRLKPARVLSPWLGWMAAAAALVLAILGWLPDSGPRREEPRIADFAASSAQARSDLLARAADVVQVDWTATEDPAAAKASGDVVWSDSLQEGYMRFRGLLVNDPDVWQYQLWIFDPQQDERYPIDGGVFDIPSYGEVVVPIDAKLGVTHASMFAITIEKPGGVVVSSRERLPLLAQVG